MPTYVDEKRRRIEQFAQFLRLMGLRRHKFVKDDCYIIFDDLPPEDTESRQLKESLAIKVDCLAGGESGSGTVLALIRNRGIRWEPAQRLAGRGSSATLYPIRL